MCSFTHTRPTSARWAPSLCQALGWATGDRVVNKTVPALWRLGQHKGAFSTGRLV